MYFLHKNKMAVFFLLAIFFVILDRFLKNLAIFVFSQTPVNLIGSILKLNYSQNYNIALSLPLSGRWLSFFILFIIVLLLSCIVYLLLRQKAGKTPPLLFVVLGAFSNLIDRFKYGFVVDYIDLKYFTVFNIADVMIVSGLAILAWQIVVRVDKNKN